MQKVKTKREPLKGEQIDDGFEALSADVRFILEPIVDGMRVINAPPAAGTVSSATTNIYCYGIEQPENRGFTTVYKEYNCYIQYLITFSGVDNHLAARCCMALCSELGRKERYIIGQKIMDAAYWQVYRVLPQPYVSVKIPVNVKLQVNEAALVREPHSLKMHIKKQ